MPIALSIAGFDPSSGAGVTADLKVFAAHGIFGTACVTALTVQNTSGVEASHAVAPEIVQSTLKNLCADLRPDVIKIGMLATEGIVEAVVRFLRDLPEPCPVVLDPVLRSSSGRALLSAGGVERLRQELLPLVSHVTPNVDELAVLTGRREVHGEELVEAAWELQRGGRELAVIVTGGHLMPPDDIVLLPGGGMQVLEGVHLESRATHGTGCAFSSALAANLVLGRTTTEAAAAAKSYVAQAMLSAERIGHGRGPMQLLWPLSVGGPALPTAGIGG